MFPILHTYFARQICQKENSLIGLGAILPDLGTLMGLERKAAHEMGQDLLPFCREHYPQQLDFALAYASHGTKPACLDYFADENWQKGPKGYCFQKAEHYKERVKEACNLPDMWAIWKGHNFVEMSFELLTLQEDSRSNRFLLRCLEDKNAIEEAITIYHAFCGVDKNAMRQAVLKSREIFCIEIVTPEHLALHYARQLYRRHEITGVQIEKAAQIIEDMQKDLCADFVPFLQEAARESKKALAPYLIEKEQF